MSIVSGWIVVVCILVAGAVPVGWRLRTHKRAAPGSLPIGVHMALGFATSGLAFVHALSVLPELGSSAAIEGGMLAILPAVAAFFLLVAHTGIGLQLRNGKLRGRVAKRRSHQITACSILLAVAMHVVMLRV